MEPTKKLSEKLNDYMLRKDNLGIGQWRFIFSEGRTVSVGLDNNQLGGPYSPPATHETYGGTAYIRWADGEVSNIPINARTLEELDQTIKEWKFISYYDADAPDVIEPLPMPKDLEIKDERIVDLIKDKSYFFETLNFYNKRLSKKDYTRTVSGEVKAEHLYTTIMNSKGLDLAWEETDMSIYASVNNQWGDAYHKRRMPDKKDLNKIIKEIDKCMIYSKNILPVKEGKMPVIFTPGVLEGFLGKYVVENLQGKIVVNNQSPYSIEDFKTKKQVFDKRINLVLDGLLKDSPSTQPCSREGVPSTKQYIIANGRVITPFLDLKHAKKSGMPSTSIGNISLEVAEKTSYNKLVKGMDYGLLIYSVLGMHTLNTKEGKYSVTVNQGLLVENGRILGKIKPVAIEGNFFEALKDENTKFADYRKDEIAMMIEANVTV